ncbi:MAG: ATP-binding cassette domain-containing protein [Xylophilus ampelinus]
MNLPPSSASSTPPVPERPSRSAGDASAGLRIEAIAVAYETGRGARPVLDGFSLELGPGALGCLLGPSGCGKTTVLRAVAGFEPLRAGTIALDGALLSGPGVHRAPERRRVGMVFQEHALFPHLSAAQNVAFGLRRLPRAAQAERVRAMLALVGLEALGGRHPHALSGGQQQRVALARALAPAPDLLLLDEPFSSLDPETRERLSAEVRGILRAAGQTALMVTHHEAEAAAMADRIGRMDGGRLLRWDANPPPAAA